jgi:HK97 family phage prohead protease
MWHEHGGPLIGSAREVKDQSDGVWVRAKFSNTLAGQEARELASDGTLDQCSVEFKPLREWMRVERRADGLHVRHARAQLFGFALTTRGMYGENAYIASVRDEQASKERDAVRARLLGMNH